MKLATSQFARSRKRRPGIAALALLGVLATMLAVVGVVLDMIYWSGHRQQLQVACDALALAGAAELAILSPDADEESIDLQGDWHPSHSHTGGTHGWMGPDVFRTQRRMRMLTQHQLVAGENITVGFNQDTDQLLASTFWFDEQDSETDPRWQGVSVHVANFDYPAGHLSRWWLKYVRNIDLQADVASHASIDRHVYGFRQVGHVAIPIMPLVVGPLEAGSHWHLLALSPAIPGQNDQYTVNPYTGEVHTGADGIPELKLSFATSTDDEDEEDGESSDFMLRLALLGSGEHSWRTFSSQAHLGLLAEDLSSTAGQIVLPWKVLVEDLSDADDQQFSPTNMRDIFLSVRGEKRAWPTTRIDSHSNRQLAEVTNFVAASVVDCRVDSSGGLTIVVQPCFLQTCTALTNRSVSENRWIGKVVLGGGIADQ